MRRKLVEGKSEWNDFCYTVCEKIFVRTSLCL